MNFEASDLDDTDVDVDVEEEEKKKKVPLKERLKKTKAAYMVDQGNRMDQGSKFLWARNQLVSWTMKMLLKAKAFALQVPVTTKEYLKYQSTKAKQKKKSFKPNTRVSQSKIASRSCCLFLPGLSGGLISLTMKSRWASFFGARYDDFLEEQATSSLELAISRQRPHPSHSFSTA